MSVADRRRSLRQLVRRHRPPLQEGAPSSCHRAKSRNRLTFRMRKRCLDTLDMTEGYLFPKVAKILTVADLTRSIRERSRRSSVRLGARRSLNYKLHPSGHQYFTLKDQRAQHRCVIFRNAMAPMRVPLTDARRCKFTARLSLRSARQYQLSVQIVQTRGSRPAPGKVRGAQTQTGSGGIV